MVSDAFVATLRLNDAVRSVRRRAEKLVGAPAFGLFISIVIGVNAVTLGLETSPAAMAAAGGFLFAVDRIALVIFTIEIALKLFAFGPRFFRSGWNVFDFVIVAISLVPAAHIFSVLRALRILRALRLLSVIPQLRTVVGALLGAVPGMSAIIGVLVLVFYVAGVIATKLFGPQFPDWFGSVGASMYTLFQIMTLESWSMGIVRPVMEAYPWAWAFFVPFIIITSFAVLNLFIALIVNSMQVLQSAENENRPEPARQLNDDQYARLLAELNEIKQRLEPANTPNPNAKR